MSTQALKIALEALEEYADMTNWRGDGNAILRVWREPRSQMPEAYNGFECATIAINEIAAALTVSNDAQPVAYLGRDGLSPVSVQYRDKTPDRQREYPTPLYDRPAPDVRPSALTDRQILALADNVGLPYTIGEPSDGDMHATWPDRVVEFAYAMLTFSTPASVPSDEHPLAGLYINQGSMDAAADAYAAKYEEYLTERARHALQNVLNCLLYINSHERAIVDTLWFSNTETLFDYIRAELEALSKPSVEIAPVPGAATGKQSLQVQQSDDAKDAVRYRWLRDECDSGAVGLPCVVKHEYVDGEFIRLAFEPAELDAAIDAAIAAQPQADIKDKP